MAAINDASVRYGFYLVAFIDVLGQQQELMKLTKLPHNHDQGTREQINAILTKTAGSVAKVRESFKQFFEAAQSSSLAAGHRQPTDVVERYKGLAHGVRYSKIIRLHILFLSSRRTG